MRSDNSEVAVLQDQSERMQYDVTEIKGDVKTIIQSLLPALEDKFVTKSDFTAYKAFDWLRGVGVALTAAIIGGLVSFFFSHKG